MRNPYQWIFRGLLTSLISFLLVFGLPFLSAFVSYQIIVAAGCQPFSLGGPGSCPDGSFANRFLPLSLVLITPLAPWLVIKHFWDILLGWALLTAAFGLLARRRNQATAGQAPSK